MRWLRQFIVCVPVLLAITSSGQKRPEKQQTFRSPDGALVAIVTSQTRPQATAESRIEIRKSSGKVLASQSYTSDSGEHGYGIAKAQWTPNSRFFVFSLESSGGHSAWHSPVLFFSVERNEVFSLDDALRDAVMNPQFKITAPDKVTVELYFTRKTGTVSLSTVRNVNLSPGPVPGELQH